MLKTFFFTLFTLFTLFTVASQNIVTRDSTGYRLTQNRGRSVPLDTTQIAGVLKAKIQDQEVVQTEISLMEQLLQRRRQLSAIVEDRRTLQDILDQARALKPKKP